MIHVNKENLLNAIRSRNEERAFRLIIKEYSDLLVAIASSYRLGKTVTPDDVLQTVLENIVKHGGTSYLTERSEAELKNLLCLITTNVCRNIYKTVVRVNNEPIDEAIKIEEASHLLSIELSVDLQYALSRLSKKQSVIFRMNIEGYTFEEISYLLSIKESTVKYHFYKAKKEVQAYFKK